MSRYTRRGQTLLASETNKTVGPPPKLRLKEDLNGTLVRFTGVENGQVKCEPVQFMRDAQGVLFACPACSHVRAHAMLCWFRSGGSVPVPDALQPKGRWHAKGTTIDDLMFYGPQLVVVSESCGWKGIIFEGRTRA